MSKKYIIEIEDEPLVRQSALYGEDAVYRAVGFRSLVFDQNGLDKLMKYDQDIVYQRGMEAAWEAAKMIVLEEETGGFSISELREIFGTIHVQDIMATMSINEVKKRVDEVAL